MKYIYYFLLVLWFIPASAQKSETAKYLESIGLVNIAEADSSIVIDLMYTARTISPEKSSMKICTKPICIPTS